MNDTNTYTLEYIKNLDNKVKANFFENIGISSDNDLLIGNPQKVRLEYQEFIVSILNHNKKLPSQLQDEDIAQHLLYCALYDAHVNIEGLRQPQFNTQDIFNCSQLKGESLRGALKIFYDYHYDYFFELFEQLDNKGQEDFYNYEINKDMTFLAKNNMFDKIDRLFKNVPNLVLKSIDQIITKFEMDVISFSNKDTIKSIRNTIDNIALNKSNSDQLSSLFDYNINEFYKSNIKSCKALSSWMSDEQKIRVADIYRSINLVPDAVFLAPQQKKKLLEEINQNKAKNINRTKKI